MDVTDDLVDLGPLQRIALATQETVRSQSDLDPLPVIERELSKLEETSADSVSAGEENSRVDYRTLEIDANSLIKEAVEDHGTECDSGVRSEGEKAVNGCSSGEREQSSTSLIGTSAIASLVGECESGRGSVRYRYSRQELLALREIPLSRREPEFFGNEETMKRLASIMVTEAIHVDDAVNPASSTSSETTQVPRTQSASPPVSGAPVESSSAASAGRDPQAIPPSHTMTGRPAVKQPLLQLEEETEVLGPQRRSFGTGCHAPFGGGPHWGRGGSGSGGPTRGVDRRPQSPRDIQRRPGPGRYGVTSITGGGLAPPPGSGRGRDTEVYTHPVGPPKKEEARDFIPFPARFLTGNYNPPRRAAGGASGPLPTVGGGLGGGARGFPQHPASGSNRSYESRQPYDNRHNREQEEDEPEWFSEGPTSQNDVIELQGLEEIEKGRQGSDRPEEAKVEEEEEVGEEVWEEDRKGQSQKSEDTPANPSPPPPPTGPNFDFTHMFEIDTLPSGLLDSQEAVPVVGSRFSKFFGSEEEGKPSPDVPPLNAGRPENMSSTLSQSDDFIPFPFPRSDTAATQSVPTSDLASLFAKANVGKDGSHGFKVGESGRVPLQQQPQWSSGEQRHTADYLNRNQTLRELRLTGKVRSLAELEASIMSPTSNPGKDARVITPPVVDSIVDRSGSVGFPGSHDQRLPMSLAEAKFSNTFDETGRIQQIFASNRHAPTSDHVGGFGALRDKVTNSTSPLAGLSALGPPQVLKDRTLGNWSLAPIPTDNDLLLKNLTEGSQSNKPLRTNPAFPTLAGPPGLHKSSHPPGPPPPPPLPNTSRWNSPPIIHGAPPTFHPLGVRTSPIVRPSALPPSFLPKPHATLPLQGGFPALSPNSLRFFDAGSESHLSEHGLQNPETYDRLSQKRVLPESTRLSGYTEESMESLRIQFLKKHLIKPECIFSTQGQAILKGLRNNAFQKKHLLDQLETGDRLPLPQREIVSSIVILLNTEIPLDLFVLPTPQAQASVHLPHHHSHALETDLETRIAGAVGNMARAGVDLRHMTTAQQQQILLQAAMMASSGASQGFRSTSPSRPNPDFQDQVAVYAAALKAKMLKDREEAARLQIHNGRSATPPVAPPNPMAGFGMSPAGGVGMGAAAGNQKFAGPHLFTPTSVLRKMTTSAVGTEREKESKGFGGYPRGAEFSRNAAGGFGNLTQLPPNLASGGGMAFGQRTGDTAEIETLNQLFENVQRLKRDLPSVPRDLALSVEDLERQHAASRAAGGGGLASWFK